MKRLAVAAAAAISAVMVTGHAPGAHAQSDALAQDLDRVRAEAKLVGVAAVVMVDGEVVESAASGKRRRRGTDMAPDDAVHIGSIGKSITATAIARMVERGEIDWDDTVGERLPEFAQTVHPGWQEVTLDQLLGHRAGLPAMGARELVAGRMAGRDLVAARREIMTTLLAKAPEDAPGTAFAYRNSGYVLASMMAEAVAGDPWERVVAREVIEPLGLGSAGFGAPRGKDAPWGHAKLGPIKLEADPLETSDNPMFMSAAGTLHMGLEDLARYGWTHAARDTSFLEAGTYARLHAPVLNDYALGWVVESGPDWFDGDVIWHNGSNTMWYALLVLIPESDMVVAVATNDGDVARAGPAFFKIVEAATERWAD